MKEKRILEAILTPKNLKQEDHIEELKGIGPKCIAHLMELFSKSSEDGTLSFVSATRSDGEATEGIVITRKEENLYIKKI